MVSGPKNVMEAARSSKNESQKPHYMITATMEQVARSGERVEKHASLFNGGNNKDFVAIFNLT